MDTQRLQGAAGSAVRTADARPVRLAPVRAKPAVQPTEPLSERDERAQQVEAEADAAKPSREQGERVAQALNRHVASREVNFSVRDPNKTGANNVIIEIKEGDKVIATIPSKEVLEMADRMKDGMLGDVHGVLLNQKG